MVRIKKIIKRITKKRSKKKTFIEHHNIENHDTIPDHKNIEPELMTHEYIINIINNYYTKPDEFKLVIDFINNNNTMAKYEEYIKTAILIFFNENIGDVERELNNTEDSQENGFFVDNKYDIITLPNITSICLQKLWDIVTLITNLNDNIVKQIILREHHKHFYVNLLCFNNRIKILSNNEILSVLKWWIKYITIISQYNIENMYLEDIVLILHNFLSITFDIYDKLMVEWINTIVKLDISNAPEIIHNKYHCEYGIYLFKLLRIFRSTYIDIIDDTGTILTPTKLYDHSLQYILLYQDRIISALNLSDIKFEHGISHINFCYDAIKSLTYYTHEYNIELTENNSCHTKFIKILDKFVEIWEICCKLIANMIICDLDELLRDFGSLKWYDGSCYYAYIISDTVNDYITNDIIPYINTDTHQIRHYCYDIIKYKLDKIVIPNAHKIKMDMEYEILAKLLQ